MVRYYGPKSIPEVVPDPEWYGVPTQMHRFYRPWMSRELDEVITPEVSRNTMLSRIKLYFLVKFVRQTLPLHGDILEAGVGSGGSSRLMLNCLLEAGVTAKSLWLLDTFDGYPTVDRRKDGTHMQPKDCRCQPKDYVAQLLKNERVPVHLVEGAIPGTLRQVQSRAVSFAHIDVNLYEPTLAATLFCLERMPPGGIILFDDYGWPATYGARQAIDEASAQTGNQIISLPESTQAFLIKR